MKQEINLDKILKSYLTVEAMRINKPDYTYNMVIAAMKHACELCLDLAANNAWYDYQDLKTGEIFDYSDVMVDDGVGVNIDKNSILQIKNWIK